MSFSEFLFAPADLPPAVKYEKLFENSPKLKEQMPKTGRRSISRNSLLKALIYKSLRRFPFLADLTFELNNNPIVFKELYNKPTSVERILSRLLAIAMQNPTVRGYNANRNHATIAHISVLLVALTAYRTGQKDKMRFEKSFVLNFLIENI